LWKIYKTRVSPRCLNSADLFCPDGIAHRYGCRAPGKIRWQSGFRSDLIATVSAAGRYEGNSSLFFGDTLKKLTTLRTRRSRVSGAARRRSTIAPLRELSVEEERDFRVDSSIARNPTCLGWTWVCRSREWAISSAYVRTRRTVVVGGGESRARSVFSGAVERASSGVGDAGFGGVGLGMEPKKTLKARMFRRSKFVYGGGTRNHTCQSAASGRPHPR